MTRHQVVLEVSASTALPGQLSVDWDDEVWFATSKEVGPHFSALALLCCGWLMPRHRRVRGGKRGGARRGSGRPPRGGKLYTPHNIPAGQRQIFGGRGAPVAAAAAAAVAAVDAAAEPIAAAPERNGGDNDDGIEEELDLSLIHI